MDAVRAALVTLKLNAFEEALVDNLLEKGYLESIPASALVPALREAGVRGTQVLEVRKLALLPTPVAPLETVPVCRSIRAPALWHAVLFVSMQLSVT